MNIEEIILHSFKDFHVKGFEYLCVKRTPEHTIKYYFFNGDILSLPEVVSPHDHRYDFSTSVIAGSVANSLYMKHRHGNLRLNHFNYRTPLNGGDGFEYCDQVRMFEKSRIMYHGKGSGYFMRHNQIHTIHVAQQGTILRLDQYEDKMPLQAPSATFFVGNEAPDLKGLYTKFTVDEVVARLKIINDLSGLHFI